MKEGLNEDNKKVVKDDILDENIENDMREEKETKVGWYISLPIIIILMLTKLYPLGIVLIIIRLVKTKNNPGSRNLTYLIIIAIGIYYIFAGVPDLITEKNNTNTSLSQEDKSGIKLYTFDEKDDVDSYFENSNADSVYLKEKSKWFSADYYALTPEPGNVKYIGEMKDNKPDGIGKLMIDDKVEYIGEFNDGRFEGYGEDYDDNLLVYDGYFKKGKYQGKGNEYFYPNKIFTSVNPDLLKANNISLDKVIIYVGTYKKGEAKGDFKIYNKGYLLYDGELKHDKMNGKGTVYYENLTQIKYEGEFRTNEYNGKGTLYDESGKVIYEGKWDMGDYAN